MVWNTPPEHPLIWETICGLLAGPKGSQSPPIKGVRWASEV